MKVKGSPAHSVPCLQAPRGLWTQDCPRDTAVGPSEQCSVSHPCRASGATSPGTERHPGVAGPPASSSGRSPGLWGCPGPRLPSLSTLGLPHFAKSELKLGADVWDPSSVCRLLPATMGTGGGVRRKLHHHPPHRRPPTPHPGPSCLGLLWSGPCPSGWGLQGSRNTAGADMALDPQKRVQGPLLQNSRGFVETSPTSTEPGLGTRSP